MLRAACLALAAACCACTSASASGPANRAGEASQNGAVITVGSFNFPESVLLADIYAGALGAKGFPVRVLPDLGPRELVDPALMSGLIQVVPEHSGSALEFVSVGRLSATSDAAATSKALAGSAAGRGLVAGRPSAAQDANVIMVTAATAAHYGLRSVADLARVAPRLAFGGPPECPERVYCLLGLRQVYRLRFRVFVPLDAGGPLTLVRRDAVTRYGPRLLEALDTVSARLSTGSLRALDAQVELRGQDPRLVAESWLRAHGLIPGG